MRNVVGVISVNKSEFEAQSAVVGVHYDYLGMGWPDVKENNKGKIHHDADDNASAMAVLIELVNLIGKSLLPDQCVVVVAFAGKEAGKKGSQH